MQPLISFANPQWMEDVDLINDRHGIIASVLQSCMEESIWQCVFCVSQRGRGLRGEVARNVARPSSRATACKSYVRIA